MKRMIAMFGVGLACAIAMSSACATAENYAENQISAGLPLVLAAATEADKKKFSEDIQKHYKPAPAKASVCTGSTGRIAACSVSCSAACIIECSPPKSVPWGSNCEHCVNPCMDKCTGCGS